MQTRFLLILPAHRNDYDSWARPLWQICRIPPVGLIGLASYLKSRGHSVRFVDCRELIYRHRTNELRPILWKIIDEFKPEVIGLSMTTALFESSKKLARALKTRYPHIPLIAGGPHSSVEPFYTLDKIEHLDGICIGAGEEVCLDIAEGNNPATIPGLMLRGSEENYRPGPVEKDIDRYPFPDYNLTNHRYYSEYSAYTTFGWLTRSLSALTTRSCYYSCKFCASDWSKPFRRHSPEYVLELARYLSGFDINTIAFWDDSIGAIKDRLETICHLFIESGLFFPRGRLRWRAHLRANQITPDLMNLMKKAGCFAIGLGLESASDRILRILNKKSTVEMNERAVRYILEAGIDPGPSFMLGVPDETEEEMLTTIENIKRFQKEGITTIGCGSFRPLPGSPFYAELTDRGDLHRTEVDWNNLGDFSALPDKSFCRVGLDRLRQLVETGLNTAYSGQPVNIHQDVALENPGLVRQVSAGVPTRIAPLPGPRPNPDGLLTGDPVGLGDRHPNGGGQCWR
jgi:radical SAM superfamily enzyme YgiQ (UPF0313 family)